MSDLDATYVRAERLTIDHDEVIVGSDGSRAMMKFVAKHLSEARRLIS